MCSQRKTIELCLLLPHKNSKKKEKNAPLQISSQLKKSITTLSILLSIKLPKKYITYVFRGYVFDNGAESKTSGG